MQNSPFRKHKILGHLPVLNSYVNGGWYAPIQVEIDLTNACTSACPWCAGFKDRVELPFMLLASGSSKKEMAESSRQNVSSLLDDLKDIGVKSITWTGGGDPTVHPHHQELIRKSSEIGMDAALITNGVIDVSPLVDCLEWVRFSVDAGTEETYERQHGRKNHFLRVIDNVSKAVDAKRLSGSDCTIGVGFVASADVIQDFEPYVRLWSDIAVDYIQFRPRMDTLEAKWGDSSVTVWDEVRRVSELDSRVVSSDAKVEGINHHETGTTPVCHGSYMETAIAADGLVYQCCHLKGDATYAIGNLHSEKFSDIWSRHIASKGFVPTKDCPLFCRHYGTNVFVESELVSIRTHANFI